MSSTATQVLTCLVTIVPLVAVIKKKAKHKFHSTVMFQPLKKFTTLTEVAKFLNNCYDIKLQESMLKITKRYRLRNLAQQH